MSNVVRKRVRPVNRITLTDVLVVKAPEDAAADVETQIIVTISSDYNASINSTYTSRTTVLQNYEPKLAIQGEDNATSGPYKFT